MASVTLKADKTNVKPGDTIFFTPTYELDPGRPEEQHSGAGSITAQITGGVAVSAQSENITVTIPGIPAEEVAGAVVEFMGIEGVKQADGRYKVVLPK